MHLITGVSTADSASNQWSVMVIGIRQVAKFVLAVCLLAFGPVVASLADESSPSRPDVPWGMARLQSLNRSVEMLQQLQGDMDFAPLAAVVEKLDRIRQLPGFDAARPIVLLAYAGSGSIKKPELVLSLPVSDAAQFVAACRGIQRITIEDVSANRWRVRGAEKEFAAVAIDGQLLISNQASLLAVPGNILPRLLESLTGFDFTVSLLPAGVPNDIRSRWLQLLAGRLDEKRAQAEQATGDEGERRRAILTFLRYYGDRWHDGIQRVDLGLKLENGLTAELRCSAIPESRLAQDFSRLTLSTATARKPLRANAAAELQLAVDVPTPVRHLLGVIFKQLKDHVSREVGPHLKMDDRAPASGVFDAVAATMAVGRLESTLAFIPTVDHHFVFLAATAIERSDRLAESLSTVLPYAAQSDDIRAVDLNVLGEAAPVLHRIQPAKPKEEDRRIYGDNSALYVGTTSDTFLFAVGGPDAEPLLKNLEASPLTSPNLLTLRWQTRPWIEFVQTGDPKEKTAAQLAAAFPVETPEDVLAAQLRAEQDQLRLTVTLERGYLRLLGLLARN